MCLILFAYDYHPRYQLVVAANRDEFYHRPTLPADFWPDYPNILAGRDLEQGGTWMGITTSGAFAALTNYRGGGDNKANAPSRGQLVREFLCSTQAPEAFIQALPQGGADYNGFNLLLGTPSALSYYSNREKVLRRVDKGVHGLSNNLLDVPWPKVRKGISALGDGLKRPVVDPEELFRIMANQDQAPDHELPHTGVTLEWERLLSAARIESADYGTKSTTLLLVDRAGNVQFWERSYAPGQPDRVGQVYYEFAIDDKGR